MCIRDRSPASSRAVLPNLDARRTARLLAGDRPYAVLQRGLDPAQRRRILELGNPALTLRREVKRVYPSGQVTAHVVGFVDTDLNGLAGLELRLDRNDERGARFATTLDIRVQHVVRDVLRDAMRKFDAEAAAAVVMDVSNGEIVALVSLPDFDPNRPMATPRRTHFNRVTLGVYELGSVFKLFTAAMAVESGLVTLNETFETSEPLQIGRHAINDSHGQKRPLTVSEVVTYSSNIGSAQIALRVPDNLHYDFLEKLGLTRRLEFDLPETTAPLMPKRWTDIERATASYGHGLAVTPLHALAAGAAMVNGGVLYPPRLTRTEMPVGARIISAQTSARMREIMRAVVVSGTGGKADASGYGVMGKTGSADKPYEGDYDAGRLVTSFIGAFPHRAPRYALLVMFDEPQGIDATHGFALAGWNAAPAAGEIVARIAPLLGVMPQRGETERLTYLAPLPAEGVAYAP